MTFTAACGWSLLRSAIVAVVGLWGAVHLNRLLAQQRVLPAPAGWMLLAAPFLAPGLVVGYGYRNYSLSLVHYPTWNEALYAAILIAQATPVGVLMLHFAPPSPLSASAVHCVRLARLQRGATFGEGVRRRWAAIAAAWRGPRQTWLAAAAMMFLIAFQESETAALMQVRGWPEWLFTRYAGLVDLTATRQKLLTLVAIQAVILIPVLVWLWRNLTLPPRSRHDAPPGSNPLWWAWPVSGAALVIVVPSLIVLRGVWDGFAILGDQPSFWRELLHGVVFAATSGGLAFTLSGVLLGRISRRDSESSPGSVAGWVMAGFLGLLLLPGFCGSMTLALLVDDLFQHSWLSWAYDTPARMLTALTLCLLPRAVLIRTCVPIDRTSPERQTAGLLHAGTVRQQHAARELDWRLLGSRRFWALVVICSWGYLDLMIATISAPVGMEPVVKRLYNFMHFGHIAGLSAMVFVTVASPLLVVIAMLLARRSWSRWKPA